MEGEGTRRDDSNIQKCTCIALTAILAAASNVEPVPVIFTKREVLTPSIQTGLFRTPNSFADGHSDTHTYIIQHCK